MLVVLLLGCITCLQLAPVIIADGRVFVLELRNSSGLLGHRDAERACAAQHARLASAGELHQAVVDCFFSTCTRGWLHGATVGTTVCNAEGSTMKVVDVKTENVTEDFTDLGAFCIKDKGKPCGDPPSFPNAHLQGHTGFELGDELLYSCMPGHVMPSGNSAFSLLCDSCGEWYGLVQLCVKDDAESLIDYEDQFTDSYKPPNSQGQVYQEVQDAVFQNGKGFQEQSEVSFNVDETEHQDEQAVLDDPGESIDLSKKLDEVALGEEQAEEGGVGDFIVNQSWNQERTEVARSEDIPATHSPVSLLSQKHMFWFPSEAFQEGHPISVSTNSATQSSTGIQSNESKEQESKEVDPQHTVDFTDQLETFDSHPDSHNDSRSHEHDTLDSHQDKRDDHVTIYIPTQHSDRNDDKDRHDDHYDMGEHEEDRIRVRYDSREYDGPEQTYEEHESYEDHTEHPDLSQEQVDHNTHEDTEEPYDPDDNDSYEDNSRQHVIFTMDGERHNVSQKATGTKATTDDTWLDGYPIVQKDAGQDATTTQKEQVTANPNEIDVFINTQFPNTEVGLDQLGKEEATAAARPKPSDSQSFSDTIDYDTQQAAPTNSWLGDLTQHPYQDQGPVPSLIDLDGDRDMEEHTIDNLPGEAGERGEVEGEKGVVERGEMEGERGEAVCADENCPPPSSSRRGPTVAAIIIAVCVVAAAVIMGVWCYRRQLQKSSVYEMNGKGQSQKRQGQQMEMQQKV